MTPPVVIEIHIRLEPVTADPFIDGVGGAAGRDEGSAPREKKTQPERAAGSVAPG
jgi:hypothetical protein